MTAEAPEHLKRVQEEYYELRTKEEKLYNFLNSKDFTFKVRKLEERRLLREQYRRMCEYEEVLALRLKLNGFPIPDHHFNTQGQDPSPLNRDNY